MLRDKVQRLLGGWGETRLAGPVEVGRDGDLRHLRFGDIPAVYLPSRNGAAVLYCHAHGNRYDIGLRELKEGRPALMSPWLPEFAARGWGVLCLEMPCFGARAGMKEEATAKAMLWQGRTLFGWMLDEQRAGAEWLAAQPGVDPGRFGVMGISMGGTLAWWLAALHPRFAAAVSMCCFADMETLITTGAHDGHGNYMTVPGLLALASTGAVSGLAAPTPLLHCVGLNDWSTPSSAFETARGDLRAAYRAAGAEDRLAFHDAREPGHEETPAMRDCVRGFLEQHLGR